MNVFTCIRIFRNIKNKQPKCIVTIFGNIFDLTYNFKIYVNTLYYSEINMLLVPRKTYFYVRTI